MANDTRNQHDIGEMKPSELRSHLADLVGERDQIDQRIDAVQQRLEGFDAPSPVEPDPEAIAPPADERDELEREIDELRARLDDADARYKRALADFQNFQRRAEENERRARQYARAATLEALIPVLDNFKLALDMDPEKTTAAQVLTGVTMIRDEMMRQLAAMGLTTIAPERGQPFDPNRHEAMLRADDPEVEPGRVVQTFQTGYALGDHVIRPAKVSVKPEAEGSDNESND